MSKHAGEVLARDHLETFYERGLTRIDGRHEDPIEAEPFQAPSRNKDTVHVPNGAIERELAEKCAACGRPLPHFCKRDGDRNRQVEPAAFLPHLRRPKGAGQPLARKSPPPLLDLPSDPPPR